MQSKAETIEEYLSDLDDTRREAISTVRNIVLENLPDGYEEMMLFGMITYAVPLSIFPDTYNKQPLNVRRPRVAETSHGALSHQRLRRRFARGMFRERYKATGKRLDMGKSCVRFRKLDDLPLDLVGETIAKTPIDEFLEIYRASRTGAKRG